jgi:uncharacterized membrane protein
MTMRAMFSPRSLTSAVLLFTMFSCSRQPEYSPAPQSNGNIVIDVSTLKQEVPQFHTYHYKGKKISFFVLRIDDKVNSFFDACASCYPHKQGYSYKDGYVTCRYCNLKFSVYKLERGLGSCYPVKIEGRLEKGKYLIPVKTLEEGVEMF